MFDDIPEWAGAAAGIVSGLTGIDAQAVLAAAAVAAGGAAFAAAKLTGKALRGVLVGGWKVARWAVTTPPPGPECRAVLANLDRPCEMAGNGMVIAGRAYVCPDRGAVLFPPEGDATDLLTARERRLIACKARLVAARLKAEAEAHRRATVLGQLLAPPPPHDEVPLVARMRPGAKLTCEHIDPAKAAQPQTRRIGGMVAYGAPDTGPSDAT